MPKPARTVDVQEAETDPSRLLREVEAGEEIAIARAGRVVARLVREDAVADRRRPSHRVPSDCRLGPPRATSLAAVDGIPTTWLPPHSVPPPKAAIRGDSVYRGGDLRGLGVAPG